MLDMSRARADWTGILGHAALGCGNAKHRERTGRGGTNQGQGLGWGPIRTWLQVAHEHAKHDGRVHVDVHAAGVGRGAQAAAHLLQGCGKVAMCALALCAVAPSVAAQRAGVGRGAQAAAHLLQGCGKGALCALALCAVAPSVAAQRAGVAKGPGGHGASRALPDPPASMLGSHLPACRETSYQHIRKWAPWWAPLKKARDVRALEGPWLSASRDILPALCLQGNGSRPPLSRR